MKLVNLNISSKGIYFVDKDDKPLRPGSALVKIINRIYSYFLDFKLFLLLIVGVIPSHTVRNFFYRLSGIKIGKGATLHMGARFYQPKNIVIGEGAIIGSRVFLDGRASLTIGKHTDIASEAMIYNSEHDLSDPAFKAREEPVEIGDYVFIGPRVIVLPDVKISDGAIVAAGAVVTKDVAEFSVVGGIPANVIGERRNNNPHYRLGRARLFQ